MPEKLAENAMTQKTEAQRVETRIPGECGNCHRRITRILNSKFPTCRTNGERFIYSHVIDEGWGIFRCKCDSVITDTWKALREAGIGKGENGKATS